MASLSRQLARWVVGLRYEDLPPEVVDRAKGVTLHSLASVLLGSQSPAGQEAVKLITGLVAGYEVMERMAADFIPTVMARGFHAGPVFGIFGPAVAAAKIMHFTEDQVNSTIALCVHLAGGNLEGPRSGGRALREGAAVRNAMLAVALAKQ